MLLERYSPEEREARILALKEKNEAFTYETFGIAEKMPTDDYAEPPFDAAAVPHPPEPITAISFDIYLTSYFFDLKSFDSVPLISLFIFVRCLHIAIIATTSAEIKKYTLPLYRKRTMKG